MSMNQKLLQKNHTFLDKQQIFPHFLPAISPLLLKGHSGAD